MAYVEWSIKGSEIVVCNCSWGCPCQFNSKPTQGDCRAAVGIEIEEGHFGDVRLDGLRLVALVAWPGPIHEGRGEVQPIIDERADDRQREALLKIMSGEETEPGTTFFSVFAATYETVHEPMFLPIEFEADREARTGRIHVPGIVEAESEPILNPVTGKPHRARITLPAGFEYHEAEYASGRVRTLENSPIRHDWEKRHAHLASLDIGTHGVVHR